MIAAFLKTFCDNTWILWRKAPRLPKIKAASLLWDVVQSLNLQIFSNSQSTSCTLVKKLFCCTVACRNDVGWKSFYVNRILEICKYFFVKKYSFSLNYKVTLHKRSEFDTYWFNFRKIRLWSTFLQQLVILLHCVWNESSTCWQNGGGKSHVQWKYSSSMIWFQFHAR